MKTLKKTENFKHVISEKDKQLCDPKNILCAAKASYKKVTEENQHLKQRIVLIKENKKLRQQQPPIEEHKNLYYPKQLTRPKKYKKIVCEEETDSNSEPGKKDAYTFLEVEIEEEPKEKEEEKETTEQNSRLKKQHQRPQQQKLPQKRKIKFFDHLNCKDGKKHRN